MIIYQLDECANSKELAESCKRQGLVEVWRWPRKLRGVGDSVGLDYVLPSGKTLLTTDRQIHFEHSAEIPEIHSGILIVAKTSSPATIRKADLMQILSALKEVFPDWHSTSIRNSILEICETLAQVWHNEGGQIVKQETVVFDQEGWQKKLAEVLQRNAAVAFPDNIK